jgi:hypothetical protein
MRGNNRKKAVFCTICFHRKHSAQLTRGRSPDSQIIAAPACLPVPKNSDLLRRPLSAYSGGTVRDFHPLPFSLASTASTSGSFQTSTSLRTGQSWYEDIDTYRLAESSTRRRGVAEAVRRTRLLIFSAPPLSGNCAIGLPACRRLTRAAPGRRSFPLYERRRLPARVLSGNSPQATDSARRVFTLFRARHEFETQFRSPAFQIIHVARGAFAS